MASRKTTVNRAPSPTESDDSHRSPGTTLVSAETELDDLAREQIERYFDDLPEQPQAEQRQAEARWLTRLIEIVDSSSAAASPTEAEALAMIRKLLVAERSSRHNSLPADRRQA